MPSAEHAAPVRRENAHMRSKPRVRRASPARRISCRCSRYNTGPADVKPRLQSAISAPFGGCRATGQSAARSVIPQDAPHGAVVASQRVQGLPRPQGLRPRKRPAQRASGPLPLAATIPREPVPRSPPRTPASCPLPREESQDLDGCPGAEGDRGEYDENVHGLGIAPIFRLSRTNRPRSMCGASQYQEPTD